MIMVRWASLYTYTLYTILLLLVISIVFMFLTSVGERTIYNETITLAPGEVKTFSMPPGMVTVRLLRTDLPVETEIRNLFGGEYSYGITGGITGIGSPLYARYTIANPGASATNVSLTVTTGPLNPFGYLGVLSL
ncbi:hypothetical protein [Methanocella arvoryzae]|uniref:Uncharacterized protein n=1 Tax=Methanocella arvoryzae (strain DSM 22066 / NBRC 105507 / MRE50) TaxID=351160 RepID=Q0W6X2_METAR|nr:hypothetical protein [Methanocella arvoryzae]CAJ35871.1 hypothetical protein RCIX436 [Methanocella arvoryzae MRE50]